MPWVDDVAARAHEHLLSLDSSHPARAYLRERGVDDGQIATYRLGYWPDAPAVTECNAEFWQWSRRYGSNRIVFPLTDGFGAVTGMQVRHLGDKGYENFVLKPKELYTPVFGLHVALPVMYEGQRAVVVEGVFDYLSMVRYAPDTVCTLTANVSNAVKRLLARYVTHVICLYDMDATGRRGAYKLAGLDVPPEFRKRDDPIQRRTMTPPFNVVFPFYSEHDPDDLRKAGKGIEIQKLVLSKPLFSFTDLTGAS